MNVITVIEEPDSSVAQVPTEKVYERFCTYLDSKGIPGFKTTVLTGLYRFMSNRKESTDKVSSERFAIKKVEKYLENHMHAVVEHTNRFKCYSNVVMISIPE